MEIYFNQRSDKKRLTAAMMNDKLYFLVPSTMEWRLVQNGGMDLPSGPVRNRVSWRFLMWRLVAGGIPTSATVSINKLYPEVLSRITRRLSFVPVFVDINGDRKTSFMSDGRCRALGIW